MKSVRVYIVIVLLVIALIGWWTLRHVRRNRLALNVYDVRDLLVDVAGLNRAPTLLDEYGFPVPSTSPPVYVGGERSRGGAPKQVIVRRLIQTIQDNVSPASWRGRGGDGEILEENGKFLIYQSPEQHDAVRTMLDKMHEEHATQITTTFDLLIGDDVEKAVHALPGAWRDTPHGRVYETPLTPEQAAELIRLAGARMRPPRLTTFNRQRAFTVVSTESSYATAGVVGQTPVIKVVPSGVFVEVIAAAAEDPRMVSFEFRFRANRLNRLEPTTAPSTSPDAPGAQVPHVSNTSIDFTGDVPSGKPILVEGISREMPEDPQAEPFRSLILVTPTIIKAR